MASSTAAPARYTAAISALVLPDTAERIERDALNAQVSKGVVIRDALETGLELAAISTELGVPVDQLVNAARLHALRATAHDGVETIGAES